MDDILHSAFTVQLHEETSANNVVEDNDIKKDEEAMVLDNNSSFVAIPVSERLSKKIGNKRVMLKSELRKEIELVEQEQLQERQRREGEGDEEEEEEVDKEQDEVKLNDNSNNNSNNTTSTSTASSSNDTSSNSGKPSIKPLPRFTSIPLHQTPSDSCTIQFSNDQTRLLIVNEFSIIILVRR